MTTRAIASSILWFALVVTPFLAVAPEAHAATASWWLKGASFIPTGSTDFASDAFKQSARNFQAAGGTYVNFVVPLYQSNVGSTDIAPGYNTPSDSALAEGIDYVHSLGMHAQVSIYLESYDGQWRANINPSDRDTWYKNYGAELMHYGQLAESHGVELYMLGAELIDMASASANSDNTARWDTMIANVRNVYHGALTYSANRGQQGSESELPNIGFWDKLDYVGVSAYYELPGDGSVASLESDWQNVNNYDITPIEQKTGKPVLFTEVGYRSVDNAHNQPWDSWDGGNYNPTEQANDYTALFDYWNKYSFMQGVDLWSWSPDPNYGGAGNIDYTPQNKPAIGVMRQWWSSAASTTQPTQPPAPPAQSTTTPPAPATPSLPANPAIDNWWPVEGVHVSGLQPFKAMIDNADVSQYQMFWQVDNGQLVPMGNNATDWPHKEASVDLSGWHWDGSAPYAINFVAKDTSGTTIAQKLVHIFTP